MTATLVERPGGREEPPERAEEKISTVGTRTGSQRAAERVLKGLTWWIKRQLRLEASATKSGTGRPWERKFLGFRINPQGQIEVAQSSRGAWPLAATV